MIPTWAIRSTTVCPLSVPTTVCPLQRALPAPPPPQDDYNAAMPFHQFSKEWKGFDWQPLVKGHPCYDPRKVSGVW